ncbi:ferrous iron transport protein A [Thalassotalea aquiviva]|uniref:FeoA family protein n=1 Tax=Thalassotalea aquiviva TaxID=3242415 RepID=UPI00352B8DF1
MTLSDVKVGEKAVIDSLSPNPSVRAKLLDLGMIPGTPFTLKRHLSWSNAYQIHVRQANLIIRKSMAEEIKVQVLK